MLDERSYEDVAKRRGVAHLKGKGVALPFFEISEDDLRPEIYREFVKGIAAEHYYQQLVHPIPVDRFKDAMKVRMRLL